jgi:hypothetical protein
MGAGNVQQAAVAHQDMKQRLQRLDEVRLNCNCNRGATSSITKFYEGGSLRQPLLPICTKLDEVRFKAEMAYQQFYRVQSTVGQLPNTVQAGQECCRVAGVSGKANWTGIAEDRSTCSA